MTRNNGKTEAKSAKTTGTGFSPGRFLGLNDQRQRFLMLVGLALALTLIIVPKGGFIPDNFAPGDIPLRDIKAPKELLIPDLPLTEKKRLEAEESVFPLYDFDPVTARDITDRLSQAIRYIQGEAAKGVPVEGLHKEVEGILGINLADQELAGLAEISEDPQLLGSLRKALAHSFSPMIVGNLQLFQADREKGITVRNLQQQKEEDRRDLTSVIGPGQAQERVSAALKEIENLQTKQRQTLFLIIQKLFRPNLTFNKNETEARKRLARDAVKPVLSQVKKGEMVVREGERVTEDQIKKLKALREAGSDSNSLRTGFGLLFCTLLLLFISHRFAQNNIRKYRPANRDLLFLVIVFIGQFLLIKVGIFISSALESAFPYIESSSYFYIFPFAAGAMLVRIVLNSEVALVFIILTSLLLGVMFGDNLAISFFALLGSMVGAHWVRQCKERTALYRAGLRIALINLLLIFGIHLLTAHGFDFQLLYRIGFGLAGGLLCAVIVTGTIPLAENLFKYTTDIKLLELANLNTPVLRELMIQAPGTYHHSIIVGNLVEAAAEEINANPLLARVAAYYHDVGKIRKPLYYIENMGNEENRHDKLAPSMSALILMSHVKDGVEIARDNRLGQPMVEIIRQHHGTSLIKFFYDKAKSKDGKDGGAGQQVDERDYRYPGPKPQTREAALIMLADAVEAASRTLTDPTPARIRGMVQKIINNIFIDGQLDECELTLKDLHNIAKSFNRILGGIFHHRISYPEPASKDREKETVKRKNVEDLYREPAKTAKDQDGTPAKSGTDDLKRLGMS